MKETEISPVRFTKWQCVCVNVYIMFGCRLLCFLSERMSGGFIHQNIEFRFYFRLPASSKVTEEAMAVEAVQPQSGAAISTQRSFRSAAGAALNLTYFFCSYTF